MAIYQTVLKCHTLMKHPNKEKPEALGKAEVVRVNNQKHSMTKLIEKKDERETREEREKIERNRREQEKESKLKERK